MDDSERLHRLQDIVDIMLDVMDDDALRRTGHNERLRKARMMLYNIGNTYYEGKEDH